MNQAEADKSEEVTSSGLTVGAMISFAGISIYALILAVVCRGAYFHQVGGQGKAIFFLCAALLFSFIPIAVPIAAFLEGSKVKRINKMMNEKPQARH